MKTLLSYFFICMLSIPLFGQDLKPAEVYRLHYHKFKYGTASKAIELGNNLFTKSLNMAGTGVMVLNAESGPWDLLVIVPMDPNEPYHNLNNEQFSQNLITVAGSEAALKKLTDEFNSYVLDEEMYYYRGQTKNALDNTKYYRTRHLKCTSGNVTEATDKGMKYLNKTLEHLGVNNLVLKAISGPDDIVVLEPMQRDNIFSNTPEYNKLWSDALKKTGTPEEISAFFKRWNEIVQREDLHYFTNVN